MLFEVLFIDKLNIYNLTVYCINKIFNVRVKLTNTLTFYLIISFEIAFVLMESRNFSIFTQVYYSYCLTMIISFN